MKRTKSTDEQIIGTLGEHEAGVKCADLCRKHGMSEGIFTKSRPPTRAIARPAAPDESAARRAIVRTAPMGVKANRAPVAGG